MSEKIVVPGEYVGPGEVFEEGPATHLVENDVYASAVGEADESSGTFRTPTKRPELTKGGIVYGTVLMVMDSLAIITIFPEKGERESPFAPTEGKVFIREMAEGYVKSARDAIRVGDIVRAKVKGVEGDKAELTLAGPELGVIKAYCSVCREPLEKTDKGLVCPNGHREPRETANDYRKYGKINL